MEKGQEERHTVSTPLDPFGDETEEYDDASKTTEGTLQEQVEGFSGRSLLGHFGKSTRQKDHNSGRHCLTQCQLAALKRW